MQVGDLDQCVHLWKYVGGFQKVDLAEKELKQDPVGRVKNSKLHELKNSISGLC